MKKILTISFALIAGMMLLASCTKRHYYDDDNNNGGTEDAFVYEYADEFFSVQFDRDGRFAVLESLDDVSYWPELDELIRGNFGVGRKRVYNVDAGFNMNVRVIETNIRSDIDAQDALDYYYFQRYGEYPVYGAAKSNLKLKSGRQKINLSKRQGATIK